VRCELALGFDEIKSLALERVETPLRSPIMICC
jgi:hypothetical protein